MSITVEDIQDAEFQIAGMEKQIEIGEKLEKLLANKEFKELISERYLFNECARFAHQAGDPALSKEQREDALQMALAAGHLRRWLTANMQMAATAKKQLLDAKEEIEAMRQEFAEQE